MTPLPPQNPLFAVLIIPPVGCPTKDVYQTFDRGIQHQPAFPPTDWQACAAANAEELSEYLVNDLEPAAFAVAPSLGPIRQRAADFIGARVHMTGSGSTLFALFDTYVQAEANTSLLNAEMPDIRAVSAQILP